MLPYTFCTSAQRKVLFLLGRLYEQLSLLLLVTSLLHKRHNPWIDLLPLPCDKNTHSCMTRANILFCSIQNKLRQRSVRIWDFKESFSVGSLSLQKTKECGKWGTARKFCSFVLVRYAYLPLPFSYQQPPPPMSVDVGLVPRIHDPTTECYKTIWNKCLCQLLFKEMKNNLGSWIICCSS